LGSFVLSGVAKTVMGQSKEAKQRGGAALQKGQKKKKWYLNQGT